MTKEKSAKLPIFEYFPPIGPFKGILSIPHSGEELPQEFKPYLVDNNQDLMQDVDYKVHELIDIDQLNAQGIAIIKSNIIRVAIDLNRPQETSLLNWKQNSKGKNLVIKEPNGDQAELLKGKYYLPYYEMLRTLILELSSKTSKVSFVDLHSMPGKAEEYHLKINPSQDVLRPDFCLSDVSGISCEPDFIQHIQKSLAGHYSKVTINNPYFGGHITRSINEKFPDINNIQIEINRSLYMDEENKELKSAGVSRLKDKLTLSLIELFENFYQKYTLL